MKQMLNRRITTHTCLMSTFSLIHFVICLLVGVQMAEVTVSDSKQCVLMHITTRILYLLMNLLVFLYYANLATKAKIQSIDIYIFDHQVKIVQSFLPFTLLLWAVYFLTNYLCSTAKFSRFQIIIYFAHLFIELVLLIFYFKWYQDELKRYGGADHTTTLEELKAGKQTDRTFNDK